MYNNKKIDVYIVNGFGWKDCIEFDNAKAYLIWKRSHPELWNEREIEHLKIVKIKSRFLPLEWKLTSNELEEEHD